MRLTACLRSCQTSFETYSARLLLSESRSIRWITVNQKSGYKQRAPGRGTPQGTFLMIVFSTGVFRILLISYWRLSLFSDWRGVCSFWSFQSCNSWDLDEFLLLEAADATNRKHWTVFAEGYRLVGLFTTLSWVMESCLSAELSTVRRKDFTWFLEDQKEADKGSFDLQSILIKLLAAHIRL